MQLSAVDLPHPEGPSSAMNSPRRIVSVSSDSALNTCPPLPAKRRVTRSSLSSLKSCFIETIRERRAESCIDARDASSIGATDARRAALLHRDGRPAETGGPHRDAITHLVFAAPTCWSHSRNISTCAFASSDCVCGNSESHLSYSGRPNSLIASWLSFGAIDSGTFFTAGPG